MSRRKKFGKILSNNELAVSHFLSLLFVIVVVKYVCINKFSSLLSLFVHAHLVLFPKEEEENERETFLCFVNLDN